MVQRYELTEDFAGNVDVTPVPDSHNGRWVSYEDYAALELKMLAALSHLERASEASPHMATGYIKMALRTLKNDN